MKWYALQVMTGREVVASELLIMDGVQTLAPVIRRQRLRVRHQRVRGWRESAMFPGYIFVRLPAPWIKRCDADGPRLRIYYGLVGRPEPSVIPDAAIVAIAQLSGAVRPAHEHRVGDRVMVRVGRDTHVVVVTAVMRERVRVLMTILGAARELTLHADRVEAA